MNKSHFLMLHGSGCIRAEQGYDTHIHTFVRRRMVLETRDMHQQWRDDPSKVAHITRQVVDDISKDMRASLGYSRISADGYSQTRPLLPEGAGEDALCVALRPFWDKSSTEPLCGLSKNARRPKDWRQPPDAHWGS